MTEHTARKTGIYSWSLYCVVGLILKWNFMFFLQSKKSKVR